VVAAATIDSRDLGLRVIRLGKFAIGVVREVVASRPGQQAAVYKRIAESQRGSLGPVT
jgi:hypothetical protein